MRRGGLFRVLGRDRGNVILTAIFISVFLFFLSIALIWTNRQDIALSLAMEHKMKGEAAARSGAMRVYSNLRTFGEPPVAMEGTLDSGARWKAQLIELPPEGDRGALVLLQCRGTSGPLSSYYTMHLLKSELGDDPSSSHGRMLGFVSEGSPSVGAQAEVHTEEGAESTEVLSHSATTLASEAKVLYGDFELKGVNLGLDQAAEKFAAYQGPLFVTGKLPLAGNPLSVSAYLPVFSPIGAAPMAYGPLIVVAPAPLTEYGLSVMTYKNEEFAWEAIPFPIPEPDDLDPPPVGLLEMEAPQSEDWNTLAAKGIGETGNTNRWLDTRPATTDQSEATNLAASAEFEIDSSATVDWGLASRTPNKRGYALRGAIAANGQTVYTFASEYMYRHFNGPFVPAPIPPILGNTITRWPCVRSYNVADKKWDTAWSALKDNGDVVSETMPDLDMLLVNSDGLCFSRTANHPQRLIELQPGGGVSLGDVVPGRRMFMYRNDPHAISDDPSEPGIMNLKTRARIKFDTLPTRIPEIFGPVVTQLDNGTIDTGLSELEVTPLGEDLVGTPEMRTVRHEYNLSYQVDPDASVATDGDNLYTKLNILVAKKEPTYEFFGKFDFAVGENITTMARYDGTRWHILPHGLLATLTTTGLSAPEGDMFCAHYNALPKAKSRYTVVSISTDPFEFNL